MINPNGTTGQPLAIDPQGGLLQAAKPGYQPKAINIDLNPAAGRPDDNYVNIDKVQAENDRRYQEQINYRNAHQSSGGKIICLAYHELGILSDELNELDQAYGAWLMKTNPKWQKAYWRYARHFVKHLNRDHWYNRLLLFVLTPLVKVWSQEMGFRMGGPYQHSRFGSVLMWMMVHFFMVLGDIRNVRLRLQRMIRGNFA